MLWWKGDDTIPWDISDFKDVGHSAALTGDPIDIYALD
jgi:hypothetical protein